MKRIDFTAAPGVQSLAVGYAKYGHCEKMNIHNMYISKEIRVSKMVE
jgi:hypothetical protein